MSKRTGESSRATSDSLRRPASREPEVMVGNYRRLNDIGKGSFAMVYRGVHKTTGALVAIKVVNLTKLSSKLKQNLRSEVQILRDLHHPHIVSLFDFSDSKSHAHLVMEYCELGDLSTLIRKRSTLGDHEATSDMIRKYPNPAIGGLNEVVARHFLQQIAAGLAWIRQRNYLHRDLKPQNLLLVPSKIWRDTHKNERQPLMEDLSTTEPPSGITSLPMLKIADFGFARFLSSIELAETLCGSPLYMAPEILRYEKYDAKADLWSTGTVLYEMMVGKPPFKASNHVELIQKIDRNKDNIKYPEGLNISSDMVSIIKGLLKRSATERISYENFFDHPVVANDIPGLAAEDKPAKEPVYNLAGRTKKVPEQPAEAESSGRRGSTSSRTPDNIRSREPSISSPSTKVVEKRPSISGDKGKERQTTMASSPRPSEYKRSPLGSPSQREIDAAERRRARERELSVQEKTDQDLAFEREYVVVEKKTVEMNAFADNLKNSPQVTSNAGALVRRTVSTNSAPYSTTAPQTSSRPWPTPKQGPGHGRQNSLEKHLLLGRSPTSATSAIAKALNMATNRVFGLGNSPPSRLNPLALDYYNPFSTGSGGPQPQQTRLMLTDGSKGIDAKDEDYRLVVLLEKLAERSDVVYGYADVKYQQLVPVLPASSPGGLLGSPNLHPQTHDIAMDDDDLPAEVVVMVSEEALVLLVHALGILTQINDIAENWVTTKKASSAALTSPRSMPANASTSSQQVWWRVNSIVQWTTVRFNEGVERSELVSRKLKEAQRLLPSDHPAHPSNAASTSALSIASALGSSASNVVFTTGASAAKLMYDRALELSRMTAINELTKTDLARGEIDYKTSIQLLEAILEDGEPDSLGIMPIKRDDAEIDGLDNESRATIKAILEQVRKRLKALRKKLKEQAQAIKDAAEKAKREQLGGRRTSIVGRQVPGPSNLSRVQNSPGNSPSLGKASLAREQ